MLLSVLAAAGFAQTTPWWDPAWPDRTMLQFDRLDQAPVRALIVLVRLEEGYNFEHDGSSGEALRFVDREGNPLAYELEAWDEGGESRIWVRVPQVLGPDDVIWMYHGNPDAPPGQDPDATWKGWDLVLHLGDPDDPRGWPGHLVGPASFEGAALGDGLEVSGPAGGLFSRRDTDGGGLTVTAQVRIDQWTPWMPDQVALAGAPASWSLGRCTDGRSISLQAPGLQELCAGTPVDDDQWHAVAARWDAEQVEVHVDGVLEAQAPAPPDPPRPAERIMVGNGPWLRAGLRGQVDEVRVTSRARSAAWLAADARSLRDELLTFCNGWIGRVPFVPDLDGDGAIGEAAPAYGCEPPEVGWVTLAGQEADCDEADPTVYPGAPEPRGDPVDRNCDGIRWSSHVRGGSCGCGGSASVGWLALVLPGLCLRRRARGNERST